MSAGPREMESADPQSTVYLGTIIIKEPSTWSRGQASLDSSFRFIILTYQYLSLLVLRGYLRSACKADEI